MTGVAFVKAKPTKMGKSGLTRQISDTRKASSMRGA